MCAMGLYMSNKGRSRISRSSEELVHHVWEYLAFVAETSIFLIAGLLIGDRIFKNHSIFWKDYLLILAFYVLLHFIRFIAILLMWPILRLLGYGLSFKNLILLTYSGLRGALAITLALFVANDKDNINEYTKDIIMFYVAATAFLTIIINGNTTSLLIKLLGLAKVGPLKKHFLGNILDKLEGEVSMLIKKGRK